MVAKLGTPLTVLQTRLAADFSPGTYHLILVKDEGAAGRSIYTLAPSNVNTSANEVTITGSTFLVDTPVRWQGSDPPAPFTTTATFWVKTKVGDVHTFAASKGGTTLDLTTQGSGTFTLQDEELDFAIDPNIAVNQVTRKEINYQGLTSRPSFSPPGSVTVDGANNRVLIANSLTLNNTSSANLIEFDKFAIIFGGSATPGNTTGTLKRIFPTGGIAQVQGGAERELKFDIIESNRIS